jgi:hypothetical protein
MLCSFRGTHATEPNEDIRKDVGSSSSLDIFLYIKNMILYCGGILSHGSEISKKA